MRVLCKRGGLAEAIGLCSRLPGIRYRRSRRDARLDAARMQTERRASFLRHSAKTSLKVRRTPQRVGVRRPWPKVTKLWIVVLVRRLMSEPQDEWLSVPRLLAA